jgi:hypothetical protein
MVRNAGLPLLLLCISCASTQPAPSGQPGPPAATAAADVVITTDPHEVMGCRLLTRTIESYDIRVPERRQKLQAETARLGGNVVLISIKGVRKGEIFSCPAP